MIFLVGTLAFALCPVKTRGCCPIATGAGIFKHYFFFFRLTYKVMGFVMAFSQACVIIVCSRSFPSPTPRASSVPLPLLLGSPLLIFHLFNPVTLDKTRKEQRGKERSLSEVRGQKRGGIIIRLFPLVGVSSSLGQV